MRTAKEIVEQFFLKIDEDKIRDYKLQIKKKELERLELAVNLFKKEQLLKQEIIDFINKNPEFFKEFRRS